MTLTTAHLLEEDTVNEILDIPEHVTTYALIPVGHPTGPWGGARRRQLEEGSCHDRWGRLGPSVR